MNVFMPVYKGDEQSHIMASHAERLKMSRCFQSALLEVEKEAGKGSLKPYKEALTCVTCHNPHISVKATALGHFNSVCQRCHRNAPATSGALPLAASSLHCTATIASRNEMQDNCVGCHMPKNGTIDIPQIGRAHV